MERTLNITEQDLRSTLDDFLEVKEEKKPESIWNIATVTGIGLVMTATAYIGNLIGSAFFGFNTPAFFSALTTIAPIAGGTLLLFMLLTAFVKNRKSRKCQRRRWRPSGKPTTNWMNFSMKRAKNGAGGEPRTTHIKLERFIN